MIKKFQWLNAALRCAGSAGHEFIRVRYSRRPVLESSHDRFDPRAHGLRCSSFGLLAGTNRDYR
jgi:hypothetical protein